MPRHENTYPKEIRYSSSGERLYTYWKKIRMEPHSPVFDNFMDFYSWAIDSGYGYDLKLRKKDPVLPWSPDNCVWLPIEPPARLYRRGEQEVAARWTKTVNRLRIHFGMKPFPVE